MKTTLKLLSLILALCMVFALASCAGKTEPATTEPAANTQETDAAPADVDADKAAADHVAELIDAIYVQERTEDTDAQCDEAKAAWDALTGSAVNAVTGRGAGLTDAAYEKKRAVIERALNVNHPDRDDVLDVLARVGGFDIAAMTGAFLGASKMRIPAVIDGFISAAAALCAFRICPGVRDYLIPSHASYEVGYRVAMDALALEPMLALDMRLGEGSGCPLAMALLEAACAVTNDMATFAEAEIDDGYLTPIRKTDAFTVKGN